MRRGTWTWLAMGLVLALSACEDEILTDVDLPKDASADRGSDAAKEGAASDAPAAPDGGSDGRAETPDAELGEAGEDAAPEASDGADGSAEAGSNDGASSGD